MVVCSPRIEKIFAMMNEDVLRCYDLANRAKAQGYDPDDTVLIPLAKNMAERVEGLVSSVVPEILGKGIPERIKELEEQYGSQDWRVAFVLAEEVAQGKFAQFSDVKSAIEAGIRVGFAYVTVGVVSSPLEGFIGLQLRKRLDDGKEYFALVYGGPIRSAGGTSASASVLIADYLRKQLGYASYDPTEKEINRAYVEISDYHERVTNLQYFPSEDEVRFLMEHLPVQIEGDPSEKHTVSNYKGLDRRLSDQISNGFCLVMGECLALKAPKVSKQLSKWGKEMGMEHWNFMGEFVRLQKEIRAKDVRVTSDSLEKVLPDPTFMKDIVAGRPVLTYPLRTGGFRLRYGRGRVSGFSADCVHPATMVVVDSFIAVGTQLKTERPGKSTTTNVCDSIEGPIVRLKDGTVVQLRSMEQVKNVQRDIEEILFLGDILICWGDFLNRAHKLLPSGFVEEWWVYYAQKVFDKVPFDKEYLQRLYNAPLETPVTFTEAVEFSKAGAPLYPKFIFYWNAITKEEFLYLYTVLATSVILEDRVLVPDFSVKTILEQIGCEHTVVPNEYIVIAGDTARTLHVQLGNFSKEPKGETTLEMVNSVARFEIKDKCGSFIGARMGRPEKAKMRRMKTSPHVLFPVGSEGGRLRAIQSAYDVGKISARLSIYFCAQCQRETIYRVCDTCRQRTHRRWFCKGCGTLIPQEVCTRHGRAQAGVQRSIDSRYYFDKATELFGSRQVPKVIKGIRGLTSTELIPEHLLKGILRAKYQLSVNKDGTIRYDMTELPCTHFKPEEIRTSIDKLRWLGYTLDIFGNELVSKDQIVELFAQDILLPSCPESPNEKAEDAFFQIAGFIDELLVKLYRLPPYYQLQIKEDLIGQLVVAMSPHTSAGVVCRIIGFTKTQGIYAHPLLHSLLRRDTDGDELGCMLLLDTLLNFSRKFLPNTRGATQDAPLVLTSQLIPSEVDDMVFDMDIVSRYPLELYETAQEYKNPWDVKIKRFGECLGTVGQYEGLQFTHPTKDLNAGVLCSAYKTLPTMREKLLGQMAVARKIRAVDEHDVARLVIERHFIRDIKGNLRKFSQQTFRCVKCNEIYRRPPLQGHCLCGGKIIFTISEGSIVKYLEPALELAERYNVSPYLKQSLLLVKDRIISVFGKEEEKQAGLEKWFPS